MHCPENVLLECEHDKGPYGMQVLKAKHGEDVRIHRFGKPQVPWWARMNAQGPELLSAGMGVSGAALSAAVEEFFEAVNTKMLWDRYRI